MTDSHVPDLKGSKKSISGKKLFYIVSLSIIAALLIGSIALNILTMAGYLPDTDVVFDGKNMPKRQRLALESKGILKPDETVLHFFSAGIFSVLEDGTFFTPERVVTYRQTNGELIIDSLNFSDVTNITINSRDDTLEDFSIILVESIQNPQYSFGFPVTQKLNAHKKFFDALTNAWHAKKPASAISLIGSELSQTNSPALNSP